MLEHSLQSCLTPSLTPAPSQKKYNSRLKTNLKGGNREIQEDPRPGVGRRKFKGFRIKRPIEDRRRYIDLYGGVQILNPQGIIHTFEFNLV